MVMMAAVSKAYHALRLDLTKRGRRIETIEEGKVETNATIWVAELRAALETTCMYMYVYIYI